VSRPIEQIAKTRQAQQTASRNRRRFIAFRVLFNARFYYPVLGVLFLDLGLTATQYTLLNFVWAIAIVFAEVPSGVLADRIGRKPLLVIAALCMVVEMAVLAIAPRNGGWLLVAFCLVNRVLSGTAEAMASGADESLAYDSLKAAGEEKSWPDVLASIMRWQSFAMPIAMLTGAAVYDAKLLTKLFGLAGLHVPLDAAFTMRLPIVLTLLSALVVVAIVAGLREPKLAARDASSEGTVVTQKSLSPLGDMKQAALWIVRSPVALFAIIGGLALDSVIRLFMTFGSVFYRLIELPVATYGLIGAASGAVGIVASPFAKWLVRSGSLLRSIIVLAGLTFVGLCGVALRIKYWGVAFTIPLLVGMMALGFVLSTALNADVPAERRATILSFKGLAFNLGYGLVSVLFALALRVFGGQDNPDHAFAQALRVLPLWLVLTLVVLAFAFRKKRAELARRPVNES
jgi:MFS family permease